MIRRAVLIFLLIHEYFEADHAIRKPLSVENKLAKTCGVLKCTTFTRYNAKFIVEYNGIRSSLGL